MAIFPRLELGIRRLELLRSVIAILVAIVLEPCAIYCYYLKSKFADVYHWVVGEFLANSVKILLLNEMQHA